MYKLLILFTLLFSSSCSSSLLKKHKEIHPAFAPYVSEIIENSQGLINSKDIKSLTIGFRNLKTPTIGRCNLLSNEIDIDITYWAFSDRNKKLEILMHEIGHCVLKRYHTGLKYEFLHDLPMKLGFFKEMGFLYDGCPASVMHPYDSSWYCFIKHKRYYMDELFGRSNPDNYNSIPWGY